LVKAGVLTKNKNMFRKCIIKSVLIEAHERRVSLDVVQRYLSIFYGINTTMFVLKKRMTWIKIKSHA
jgi:hypothetical protein